MSTQPEFVPGIELARDLAAHMLPRLRSVFPDIPMTLAYIGPGSDVLGFDTARSMDHDWGPRLTLLVPESSVETAVDAFARQLEDLLPETVRGFGTRYSRHADGTLHLDPRGTEQRVVITSLDHVVRETLAIDSLHDLSDAVWLATPMQRLLEITSGEVFVDDAQDLSALRQRLAFYPDHLWRYQLAALWMRVSQMQPFIGRTADVGDQAGALVIAAGILRDLMRIGLLQSGQYVPYSKWLGSAFRRTGVGGGLEDDALDRSSVHHMMSDLNRFGGALIGQLNDLAQIPAVDPAVVPFHTRPWQVLPAEDIARALQQSLVGTPAESFPAWLGGIDLISDSTAAHNSVPFRVALRGVFSVSRSSWIGSMLIAAVSGRT